MNPLTKISQFYQKQKNNPTEAIDFFFSTVPKEYFIDPIRTTKTKDFTFVEFPIKKSKQTTCPLCFENIYLKKALRIMPIFLENRYFFLQPSPKPYVLYHCVLIDMVHTPLSINQNTLCHFIAFLAYFKDFTIVSNCELKMVGGSVLEHAHYQVGIMDMPLFHKDAYEIDENIYLVDWFMTTYLIKTKNKNTLENIYENIRKSYQDSSHSLNPILRKCNGEYHLYLILRSNEEKYIAKEYESFKTGIGVFEAMGHFILETNSLSLSQKITCATNILKKGNIKKSISFR